MTFQLSEDHIVQIAIAAGALMVSAIGTVNIWFLRQIAKEVRKTVSEIKLLRQHMVRVDRRQDRIELRLANCKKCPTEEALGLTKNTPTLEEEMLEEEQTSLENMPPGAG